MSRGLVCNLTSQHRLLHPRLHVAMEWEDAHSYYGPERRRSEGAGEMGRSK